MCELTRDLPSMQSYDGQLQQFDTSFTHDTVLVFIASYRNDTKCSIQLRGRPTASVY